MSKSAHKDSNDEHGTIRSYIIGFLLSLVFTFIPYYMVVNHTASDSVLWASILFIAILQMLIQIFFFLHLGRGPKPLYNVAFFVATVGIVLVVVGGSVFIMNNLHYNMSPSEASKKLVNDEAIYQINGEKTGACQGTYTNHRVVIKNNTVSIIHTEAKLCDTLTFVNEDDASRDITFGSHPNHGTYAGETEFAVRKGRSKTITLSELGAYQFHDHLDATVNGYFTVTSR